MAAKDLYEKDYYKILGVPKDADAAAIKKSYRKLAKDLHPDKNAGDKKIEEKFKAVSEAYDVVSDPKRRAEYDEAAHEFSDEVTTSTCVAVFQPGYEFAGRIIRAAIVSVADPAPATTP